MTFCTESMTISSAGHLNAVDYLKLVSGAAVEDLKTGYNAVNEKGTDNSCSSMESFFFGKPCFFFENDERFSLEVLFLKLSFVREAALKYLKEIDQSNVTDIDTAFDNIRVEFLDSSSMLPTFWNYRITFVDTKRGCRAVPDSLPYSTLYDRHPLNSIWFNTFIVNRHKAIGSCVPVAKHCFWDPESLVIPQSCNKFWDRAFKAGFLIQNHKNGFGLLQHLENVVGIADKLLPDVQQHLFPLPAV